MTEIKHLVRQAVIFELALLCSISVGCTLSVTGSKAQVPQQQQPQPQQQQQGQGTPDPRQLEMLKKYGLSRETKAPPAWALGPNGHFSATPPSNFPVEIYRSNVTSTSFLNSTKGAPSAGLSISTRDNAAVVYQFYLSSLRSGGWVVQAPSAEALAKMGGKMYMLRGQKDKQMTSITLVAKQGEPGTNISISWYITP